MAEPRPSGNPSFERPPRLGLPARTPPAPEPPAEPVDGWAPASWRGRKRS